MLLTGATGFLGQAVLERLLSDHPGVHVTCLVRPRGNLSGRDRLLRLARRPVFTRWREQVGLAAVTAALTERCEVLEGRVDDLTGTEGGGSQLAGFDVVVHSASEVAFDAPVDVLLPDQRAGHRRPVRRAPGRRLPCSPGARLHRLRGR